MHAMGNQDVSVKEKKAAGETKVFQESQVSQGFQAVQDQTVTVGRWDQRAALGLMDLWD